MSATSSYARPSLDEVFLSLTGLVRTTLGLVLRTPDAVLNLGFVILFPLTFGQ